MRNHTNTKLLFLCCASYYAYDCLSNENTKCDACLWDGTDDLTTCKEYGLIDNTELVPWNVASQECLNAYNIKISSIDPTASCSSSNAFVNSLKLGDLSTSQAKLGLGIPYGGFFFQDSNNNNIPVLKDTITIDGATYDCKQSQSNCYNAMKPYFEVDPTGQKEMKDVCDTLQNQVKVDRQLEQSTMRIRICNEISDNSSIDSSCSVLGEQVNEYVKKYPSKDCSAFGFGTGSMVIPGCSVSGNEGVGTPKQSSTNDTKSSANTMVLFLNLMPTIFITTVYLLYINQI